MQKFHLNFGQVCRIPGCHAVVILVIQMLRGVNVLEFHVSSVSTRKPPFAYEIKSPPRFNCFSLVPYPHSTATDGDGGGGGDGLDWIAQATSEKPTSATPSDRQESLVESPPPADLLAAALSGNSRLVEDASSVTGGNGGVSNFRVTGKSSSSAVKQSGTTTQSTAVAGQPRRPGGWMTTALASGDFIGTTSTDSDAEGRQNVVERESSRGGGGKHVAVETASIGVQWEEGGGAAGDAPSPTTRGGLPPWAKPYARPIHPPTEAVGDDDDSRSETGERVTVESSGIQCGESVLGGRISGDAGAL